MKKILVGAILLLMVLYGSVMAQSPFSGNLDRPIATWDAEEAESELNSGPNDDDEEVDPDADDEEIGDPPTFMDEELEGSQIILCLDASGSMSSSYNAGFPIYNSGGGLISSPNRWQTVQSEAANAISAMTEEHEFDVVIYDSYVASCFGSLMEATGVTKQQAISWVYAKNTTGCTNSYDALQLCFSHYGNELDLIMFMSDGHPNTGNGHSPCSWWNCDGAVVSMAAGGVASQTKASFTFLVIQVGGSPMPFMQSLGALPKSIFVLK